MTEQLNLKQLERKAWQLYHQDGLVEVFLGILLVLAFFAGTAGEHRFFFYIPMLLTGPALLLAKRIITVPRMGQVKFGAERKAKQRKLRLVAVTVFAITVALLVATILRVPWVPHQPVVVAIGFGGMIALVFATFAYMKDFPRLYVVGLVIGAAFTLAELLDSSIPLLAAGAIVLSVGLAILIAFVRRYPVPSAGHA